jgi:hypothetical protein
MGDLLQAARADAVHPFLVLLDLLKGQAEPISQVGLAEFEHQASHAHTAADTLIDQDGRHLPPLVHRMIVPRNELHKYLNVDSTLLTWEGLYCRHERTWSGRRVTGARRTIVWPAQPPFRGIIETFSNHSFFGRVNYLAQEPSLRAPATGVPAAAFRPIC